MTTYNTGNAIGSTDARDLLDNAQALDEAINSTSQTYTDRRGVQRRTLPSLQAEFPLSAANAAAAAASASDAASEAASAASAVDAAFAEATAAQASRVAAEAARDAAQLSAGVYATTAAGLAATTSGRYFSVPSSSNYEHLILYQNSAGAALEVKRYPSSAMLTTPPWTGKTNLWPDPFLRKLSAIGDVTAFLGKNRWYGNSTPKTLGFSLVDNPIYSGKALRRDPAYNSGVLNGPAMYFSEVGAVAGDKLFHRNSPSYVPESVAHAV